MGSHLIELIKPINHQWSAISHQYVKSAQGRNHQIPRTRKPLLQMIRVASNCFAIQSSIHIITLLPVTRCLALGWTTGRGTSSKLLSNVNGVTELSITVWNFRLKSITSNYYQAKPFAYALYSWLWYKPWQKQIQIRPSPCTAVLKLWNQIRGSGSAFSLLYSLLCC